MNYRMHYYYRLVGTKSTIICNSPFNILPEGYEEITEEAYNEIINSVNQKHIHKTNEKIIRIKALKNLLAESDYKAIKYAEGIYTEEEYAPIKNQRQAWRDEINTLESELEQENE